MSKISEKEIREVMRDTFGFEDFKSETQKESVMAVLNGDKNIIVSMPTNSGKSLCFQLPSK
jgi:superfamily II DNA helicase RecQ